MNNSPFDKATEDKAQHHCESCRWIRQRRPDDIKVEAGYDHAKHWCEKNAMPTMPEALRCGGDDWESRPTPQERHEAEANMEHAVFEFKKRHGTWHLTEWLLYQLMKVHQDQKLTKGDYAGDNFRVTIRLKK